MCNLYSITKGQQAILEASRAMVDRAGNLPPLPGVFPDYAAQLPRRPRADDSSVGYAVLKASAVSGH